MTTYIAPLSHLSPRHYSRIKEQHITYSSPLLPLQSRNAIISFDPINSHDTLLFSSPLLPQPQFSTAHTLTRIRIPPLAPLSFSIYISTLPSTPLQPSTNNLNNYKNKTKQKQSKVLLSTTCFLSPLAVEAQSLMQESLSPSHRRKGARTPSKKND